MRKKNKHFLSLFFTFPYLSVFERLPDLDHERMRGLIKHAINENRRLVIEQAPSPHQFFGAYFPPYKFVAQSLLRDSCLLETRNYHFTLS